MRQLLSVSAVSIALGAVGLVAVAWQAIAAPPTDSADKAENIYRQQIAPFIKKHCVECHGADVQEGDLRLDTYKDVHSVAADLKTWQRTIEMLRSGAMPP